MPQHRHANHLPTTVSSLKAQHLVGTQFGGASPTEQLNQVNPPVNRLAFERPVTSGVSQDALTALRELRRTLEERLPRPCLMHPGTMPAESATVGLGHHLPPRPTVTGPRALGGSSLLVGYVHRYLTAICLSCPTMRIPSDPRRAAVAAARSIAARHAAQSKCVSDCQRASFSLTS